MRLTNKHEAHVAGNGFKEVQLELQLSFSAQDNLVRGALPRERGTRPYNGLVEAGR